MRRKRRRFPPEYVCFGGGKTAMAVAFFRQKVRILIFDGVILKVVRA